MFIVYRFSRLMSPELTVWVCTSLCLRLQSPQGQQRLWHDQSYCSLCAIKWSSSLSGLYKSRHLQTCFGASDRQLSNTEILIMICWSQQIEQVASFPVRSFIEAGWRKTVFLGIYCSVMLTLSSAHLLFLFFYCFGILYSTMSNLFFVFVFWLIDWLSAFWHYFILKMDSTAGCGI